MPRDQSVGDAGGSDHDGLARKTGPQRGARRTRTGDGAQRRTPRAVIRTREPSRRSRRSRAITGRRAQMPDAVSPNRARPEQNRLDRVREPGEPQVRRPHGPHHSLPAAVPPPGSARRQDRRTPISPTYDTALTMNVTCGAPNDGDQHAADRRPGRSRARLKAAEFSDTAAGRTRRRAPVRGRTPARPAHKARRRSRAGK